MSVKKEHEFNAINILEDMGDAFVSIGYDWKYIYVNQKALNSTGKTLDQMIGKTTWEVFPETLGTPIELEYRKVMEKRIMASFEIFYPPVFMWLQVRAFPSKEGISVFFRNITEVKNVMEALKESHEQFEKSFRSSPAAISITRLADGKFVDINDSYTKLFGYNREELVGKNVLEIGIVNGHEDRQNIIDNVIEKGTLQNLDITLTGKDKNPKEVLFSAEIIQLNGEDHVLATIIDITDKKNAEKELRLLNAKLKKKVRDRTLELTNAFEREKGMNDMKSQFVSMASHEFRTPLGVVLSSTNLLKQYTLPGQADKREKHINRIISSVKNLTDILDDFLSLDKLEQGMVDVKKYEFSLPEFCEDLVDKLSNMLKEGQKINYTHIDGEHVYLDEKILRNILTNLISNAIKYSSEKGEIDLNTDVQDSHIIIKVTDYGMGIPEDQQSNIFGKFFRARNAANIQGTGLGLNIVKKYVELLDGKISFTSQPNKGTTFTVVFDKEV